MTDRVLELIAVEHGAGGLGEETPSADESERTGHCGLCGLTGDEDAWKAMTDELGVPFRVETDDELSPEEQQVVREIGTPCVVAKLGDADVRPMVLAERLEAFEGDPTRLAREVRLVAEQQGWGIGDAAPADPDRKSEPETI